MTTGHGGTHKSPVISQVVDFIAWGVFTLTVLDAGNFSSNYYSSKCAESTKLWRCSQSEVCSSVQQQQKQQQNKQGLERPCACWVSYGSGIYIKAISAAIIM